MAIAVGIDEAGYGPRLGPLVVSAAVFRLPVELLGADLWKVLARGVAPSRAQADGRVVIADSKALFTRRQGLRWLEEGTLVTLAAADGEEVVSSFRALLSRLGADNPEEYRPYPWYGEVDQALPLATRPEAVVMRARRLMRALERAGGKCLGIASVPILAGRFNRLLERTGNKSEVCFRAVASLLRRIRRKWPGEMLEVTVDKQGGRTHYLGLLLRYLPETDVEVRSETRRSSKYLLRQREGLTRLTFGLEADRRVMTVALASMASKYLREVFMGMLNRYWCQRITGLEPTSGYPADAGRFIATLQQAGALESINPDILIRRR